MYQPQQNEMFSKNWGISRPTQRKPSGRLRWGQGDVGAELPAESHQGELTQQQLPLGLGEEQPSET